MAAYIAQRRVGRPQENGGNGSHGHDRTGTYSLSFSEDEGITTRQFLRPHAYHVGGSWTWILLGLRLLSTLPMWITSARLLLDLVFPSQGRILFKPVPRLDTQLALLWCLLSGYWAFCYASTLMNRWLYYYNLFPAMLRLLSLQAVCWPCIAITLHVAEAGQPITGWVVIASANALWTLFFYYWTSDVQRVQEKEEGSSMGPRPVLVLPRKGGRRMPWKRVYQRIFNPFLVMVVLTMSALLLSKDASSSGMLTSPSMRAVEDAALKSLPGAPAQLELLLLVLSSTTEKGFSKRQLFRDSTLKLGHPGQISITHRFVVGQQTRAQVAPRVRSQIEQESATFQDILQLSIDDDYDHLSEKVLAGLRWADDYSFDYLIKTDDDMFVRLDTLSHELAELGRRRAYWRGFAYFNIPPIQDSLNKNAAFDYDLTLFPPFTGGALYILSRDVVRLAATPSHNRILTKNEDQSLGIWLYPYGIRPIHDHRIQQAWICEDDMLAKHFSDNYRESVGPLEMLENLHSGRKLCHGFRQSYCGVCYPSCSGRENHWRDWGYSCDPVKGATLREQPLINPHSLEGPVIDEPPKEEMGSVADPWIIEGLLSRHASTVSQTADWHLLHWLCWTTDPASFQERHYQILEMVWAHEPRAIIFVLSTTLPKGFFSIYNEYGYSIHVIPFNAEMIAENHWVLGKESASWISKWNAWSQGPFFFSHLTDYIRYVVLYKYGGTYMDIDAVWIRAPPDSELQFIGADYSSVPSDAEWTLNDQGMYLAPGVMRFKRGWRFFLETAESAFSAKYNPDCFNCVGPRAITTTVKHNRRRLFQHGFVIVDSRVLYPLNYLRSHELLSPSIDPEANLRRIIADSWSIHLFGKMTNHLEIKHDSVVGYAGKHFSLGIPHEPGLLYSTSHSKYKKLENPELRLRGPSTYTFNERKSSVTNPDQSMAGPVSLAGRFEGLDIVFARSPRQGTVPLAILQIASQGRPRGRVSLSRTARSLLGEGAVGSSNEILLKLENASLKDINSILSSLVYTPPAEAMITKRPTGMIDSLEIVLNFGNEEAKLQINIRIGE